MKPFNAGGAIVSLIASLVALFPTTIMAGGGPLGIDHRLSQSDTGIWKRSNQNALQYLGIVGDLGFALWEGGDTRLGPRSHSS